MDDKMGLASLVSPAFLRLSQCRGIRRTRTEIGLQRYKTLRIGCSVQESASSGTEWTKVNDWYGKCPSAVQNMTDAL